ncbi:EthD domain-containing protein [Sphingopyxis sp.]|uniref:EthD domain-containing protein n=1 Tax=Sphingopyxis sp. TaxID=1908224 RepID=UPI002D76B694|nr:EthD domain-containing protein [Sphingopyxis sp.]HET6526381.1 EthD domain-containing protein [Sphingopyxis sp.]
MVGVSTVALIERRPDISRSLFTRYWRDVHGVMAARIPGFDSYTQHHVTPLDAASEPFEGIAIVTYRSEDDRAGLIHSEVTRHIHRDEQNVFRRALLYNLGEGASRRISGNADAGGQTMFIVIDAGADVDADLAALGEAHAYLAVYDLTGGDPAGWNQTDASGRVFAALLHGIWPDRDSAIAAAGKLDASAYLLDERHVMVEDGRPTPVGLRGLDAVKTIEEAGADNQLSDAVVRAVYGIADAS